MSETKFLARRFDAQRARLEAIAYRMLGSMAEAEDAVQETWLKLARVDAAAIENLGGWLTTVVSRVCLDMLRARAARHEEAFEADRPEPTAPRAKDPQLEAELADAVGLALLVVLDRLSPAERVAFVLHDMFDVPFDALAPIVDRSTDAARQLASRARRRVKGERDAPRPDRARQLAVVEAYLAASRQGDFDALLALLDPEVAVRADAMAMRLGAKGDVTGAEAAAHVAMRYRANFARVALLDEEVGILVAPKGKLLMAIRVQLAGDRIAGLELVADPATLAATTVAIAG